MNKLILKRYFNLRINANSAVFENQGIGPNLSPYMQKDKINQFCNEFNNITNFYKSSEIELYVRLNLYYDNSFNFIIKGTSFPFLFKLFYNIDKLVDFNIKNYEIDLFIIYKIIFIKNYFINKDLNNYLLNLFLKNQYKNLYYSILKYLKK